ncbi:MAG: hypothetical protein ACPGYV_05110 [Phycisphaeraceae bacterium]
MDESTIDKGREKMIRTTTALLTVAALSTATGVSAGWSHEIDLNSYEHGAVLNGVDLGFVTATADNFHNTADLLVAFDTRLTGTRDSDLQGANGNGGKWSKGNLKGKTDVLGNIFILQEIDHNFAGYTDATNSVVARPDDEGRRSGGTSPGAGEIYFDFAKSVQSIGFTLIDVEKTGEFNRETGFFATFTGGGQTATVSFKDFIDDDSAFYDPSIKFGNNSANRIAPITASQLGLSSIERATINLGGSGGVGDVKVTGVPTPTAALGGLITAGILLGRRRKQRA